uniref:Predicted protein n=1 Tax=Hordeum vulgare subsp. vulgare TaxID=112509 RepID=F2DS76_HORVV|nr:predicted protein [Hordeum vulgare subsp. vulgare]BAK07628.1 predicted protein [Hordeum vulgare subsp. vulgare]
MPTTAAARSFFSPPAPHALLHAGSRTTVASFPRGSPPTVALSLSISASAPSSPWAPAANPKYHNAKVDAGDEDVDGGDLLRQFTREVGRAGVMHEVRRRRWHEDARDKRKRKSRDAAWRLSRRCAPARSIHLLLNPVTRLWASPLPGFIFIRSHYKWRFKGPYPFDDEQESKEGTTDDDGRDNWELPGGEFPSFR